MWLHGAIPCLRGTLAKPETLSMSMRLGLFSCMCSLRERPAFQDHTCNLRPQGGVVELDGETPLQLGITKWRTLVTYVPQTRVHPKGTPSEFYFTVQVKAGPVSCT